MRLQLFLNFSVCVDAYYVPCSCLLVIIKHVYESVGGGTCALVGVTGGDLSGEDIPWVSLGCLPYLSYLTRDKENTMLQGISSVTLLSIRD
jgi:hypothetical protein